MPPGARSYPGRVLRAAGIPFELGKAKLTAAVTLSVATGYFLFLEHLSAGVLRPAAGVFLLACGAAALNQVQEARFDARMARTAARPIPSGRIAGEWALFIALAFIGSGFWVLSCHPVHTLWILGLGAFSVAWYNGVYAFLKRHTAFAVIPGALVGALPPVMGWAAAGGKPWDPVILGVAFFFFLWQVPHFWLLLLRFDRDYAAAGLPSLGRHFHSRQIARITAVWILAAAVTGILLVLWARFRLPWNVTALCAALWLAAGVPRLLGRGGEAAFRSLFFRINLFALAVMACLVGNACL